MASLIQLKNFATSEVEATTISQAVFERTFNNDIAKSHAVHTGIVFDTQIPLVKNFGLLGKAITGCGVTDTAQLSIAQKKWTPKLVGFRLSHCDRDVQALLKLGRDYKNANPGMFDTSSSELMTAIVAKVEDAYKDMIHRLLWMGDTTASAQASGGNIAVATEVPFFTPIDGLWKQIFTEIPTTAKNYVSIAENAKATETEQMSLAEDGAFNVFRSLLLKADPRLKSELGKGTLQIHCSQSLADNWRDFKIKKSLAFSLVNAENGQLLDAFNGIEIVGHPEWDYLTSSYQKTTANKINLPHRALLTTKENIPVGITAESDLGELSVHYSQDDELVYIKAATMLDVKFLESYMASVAY